jgi:hypothetical protein
MTKAPKIGDRVHYKGGLAVGPCAGIVTQIYPAYRWDDELEKETWDLLPEREWSVALTVDSIPDKWCYGPDGKFAPEVSKLARIRAGGVVA